MALGFWKQRALSTDIIEAAGDGCSLTKRKLLHDGDERPSSGDSGISECPLLGQCALPAQMKSDDDSQPAIKTEPGEAVDLTSENSNSKTEFSSVRSHDKENAKPLQRQSATKKKASSRKTACRDSARIQEVHKKNIKQETTSEIEFITSSNGTDSLRSRRIEANARERSRVHTIGAAFEALRQSVPSNCDQQKLSKLAILRIAAAYIRALTSLLEENSREFALGVEQCTQALLLDGVRSKYPKSVP